MESTTAIFRRLQDDYIQAWLRFHPEQSVMLGRSEHAHRMRSYSDDDNGALITLNRKLISACDEMNENDLEPDCRIDMKLLRCAAVIELHELEEYNWRHRNPMLYMPVDGIYQLLTHPVKDIHGVIKRKLEAIPEYLRGAQTVLRDSREQIVPLWLQNAIESSREGSAFTRDLVRNPLFTKLFSNPTKLQPIIDEAARALEGFAHVLETEVAPHAAGDFSCGRAHFDRLLNNRHFLATDADSALRLGQRLYDETREQLLKLTQKMQGDDNISGLLEKIRSNHPEASQVLDIYRERMRATTTWLEESDIVSLPTTQSLSIQQTPDFLVSHIPFAAYDPPMLNDVEQQGYYYVTLPDDEDSLKEHNYTSIHLTCAHEAFPGHHMQFVLANQHVGNNLTRALNTSATLYEGWALYCEDLVIEEGLLNNDEHRFMSLRDRLWRCLRIIIDCSIHTSQMTLEEAVNRLVDELGFSRAQAEAELNWYTALPTTPMCYATGCEMIKQAKHQVVERSNADLKLFHDSILKHGSIALPLVMEQSFSPVVWHRVHASLFPPGESE